MKNKKDDDEKEYTEEDILRMMISNLSNLDVEEIYTLGKQVAEKHLDKDSEMYKWFHDGLPKN